MTLKRAFQTVFILGLAACAVSIKLLESNIGWDAHRAGNVPQFLIDAMIATDPRNLDIACMRAMAVACFLAWLALSWQGVRLAWWLILGGWRDR